MAVYFLDSSALAKRYVMEIGSDWVTGLIRPSAPNQIHAARISGAEVVAAITRRIRLGDTPPDVGTAAIAQFRSDFEKLIRVEILAPLSTAPWTWPSDMSFAPTMPSSWPLR